MDRNIHTDDFEQLLKEKSDEFRMYPSKRVWHSVYNNIHPARKWPSIAMSITLISVLFLVGFLNTNNSNLADNSSFKYKIANKYNLIAKNLPRSIVNPVNKSLIIISSNPLRVNKIHSKNNDLILNNKINTHTASITDLFPNTLAAKTIVTKLVSKSASKDISFHKDKPSASVIENILNNAEKAANTTNNLDEIIVDEIPTLSKLPPTGIDDNLKDFSTDKKAINIAGNTNSIAANSDADNNIKFAANNKQIISEEEKNWIENYALYNKPATKKWANKLSWQSYATPSIVYRTLHSNADFANNVASTTTPLATSINEMDVNNSVNQKASLGFEIGSGIEYLIFKGVKLKVGLQLNYTRYNSNAFQNAHPVAAKLSMHDYNTNSSYEESRTTPFSNKNGLEATKLHNETFQISLPIGADIKLIGNENLQWNVGFSIQPTFVPTGRSYLISTDRRNYVGDNSMINKWNLNAGFETFVSFKSDNGITWQVGPQFRSQLFSTNSKQFDIQEKLMNYGIKVGISKNIK